MKIQEINQILDLELPETEAQNDLSLEEIKNIFHQKLNDSLHPLQTELKKVKTQMKVITPEYEKLKNTAEGIKSNYEAQIKSLHTSYQMDKIKSGLKFKPDISVIESKGFESYLADNFNFELNESNELSIQDKSGNLIYLNGIHKPSSAQEVLNHLIKEHGLDAPNPPYEVNMSKNNNTVGGMQKKIHPRAIK